MIKKIIIAICFVMTAWLAALNPKAIGAEIESARFEANSKESNLSVHFSEEPKLSNMELREVDGHLELIVKDAKLGDDLPRTMATTSNIISGVEFVQAKNQVNIRLASTENSKIIKSAARMGIYQDEILVTVDHQLLNQLKVNEMKSHAGFFNVKLSDILWFFASVVAFISVVMVVRSFRGASLPLLESRKLSDLRVKPLGYIPPTKTPQLSMIEIDQQKLLIANGPNGVQLLTSLPASRMTQTATWRDDSEKQRLVEELRKQIRQRIHQDAYWSKKT